MAIVNLANLKRTFYYLRRNGLRRTWHAVRERLGENGRYPYEYVSPDSAELKRQRARSQELIGSGAYESRFSIVVPAYRTDPVYLKEMIASVKNQTYPGWELILADATEDDSVWEIVKEQDGVRRMETGLTFAENKFESGRIVYIKLASNDGIAENTNEALPYANGNYIGLLDHDDILTEDALYEMAEQIRMAADNHTDTAFLYSDEDKFDGNGKHFYDLNRKENFNLDLILSNNYICHFMVMESRLMKKLKFRKECDGAQDYDLILRAVDSLGLLAEPAGETKVIHIPKVLYHWRCHAASTAENPRSKQYAYDAGLRALQDFADRNGMQVRAQHESHLGFYGITYGQRIFEARQDLGAAGGRILLQGRIAGGRMDAEGNVYYEGTPENFSGYLHRAVLTQDAEAVDIRCIAVRKELHALFKEVVGVPYQNVPGEDYFDAALLGAGADYKKISLELCSAIREKGYRILWAPGKTVTIFEETENGRKGHE